MDNLTLREILTPDRVALFWSKVDKSAECWTWTAATNGVGYGKCRWAGYWLAAHRIGYFLGKGDIPDGVHLDHLCRNTLCVRPEHLEAVSPRDNILRGTGYSAKHAAKSVCPRGHRYDKTRGGSRACSTCDNAVARAYQARRRSK